MSKANQIRQKAQEFLSKGHIDKAILEYRRLISIESKNPNLYNELGDIYLRAADKTQAVQNFEKAATIYEKVALYNNAVAVCKKILRVDPDKIDAMFRLGELRAKQKLAGEAATYFTQYVEAVLENPQTLLPRAQKDADIMLELMPSSEAVLAKAVEIYEQLGIKLKTIEIYGKLIVFAGQEGDSKRQAGYARRMQEIKAGLSPAELENLKKDDPVEGTAAQEAAPISGEMPEAADIPAAGADFDEPAEVPPADFIPEPSDVESARAAAEEDADDGEPYGSGIDTGVDEAVEEAEMVAAMSQGREVLGPNGSLVDRRKPSGDETSAIAKEVPSGGTPSGSADPPVTTFAKIGAEGGETLAEEITSDVEKDDLRSHFDLGMAYLEMGLFNEAIREFQIASRAEEFQLSSMEMIGYCFIKCNQPRLAVKQLAHALEIEKATGAGSLGIHYNIGLAYEMLGEFETAREHFEEVYIVDMSFRDVAEKMKKFSSVT